MSELPTSSLVGSSSEKCQTVARYGVLPEAAANSSQNTFLDNTSPRISGLPQVL